MPKVSKSKGNGKAAKPDKSYDGFPMFTHASGHWAKKIRGKLHYFGRWAEPEAALNNFNRQWPYLSEGRTPTSSSVPMHSRRHP